MTVRLKTVLALPALLLINILAGCNQDTPSGEQSAVPVIAASLESAAPGSVDSSTYSGTVKPHRQVDLAFRVSGYVKDLLNVRDASGDTRTVQAGDSVPSGVVLARLDSKDYQAQADVSAAQSVGSALNVDQAKSRVIQASAARLQASYTVTEAKSALSGALAEHDQAIALQNQAAAAKDNAQTQLNLAQTTYQSVNTLFQSGSATKPQYDDAKAALDSARNGLQAALQAQNGAQAKAAEANAQIKAAKAHILEAQAGVQSAKAAVSAGEAAQLAAESQEDQARAAQTAQSIPLAETAITAPFSGVVLTRRVEIGSLAAPGVPVFVLADTSKYDIIFGLPESKAAQLHVGAPLPIMVGNHGPFSGIVTEIAPTADVKTGVFDVQVTVSGDNSPIKIGMSATLNLKGSSSGSGTLTAPLSSLVPSKDHPNGFAVLVVSSENGQTVVHIHDVDVKQSIGDNVVVRGLSKGTLVVSSTPGLLFDGEPVTVEDQPLKADNGLR